ncbi:MAG: TIGR01777 family oxidoreductase [Limisphaerales bacterium]
MNKRVVLAGGSGLLGRMLAEYLGAKGYEIVVLSRSAKKNITTSSFAKATEDRKNANQIRVLQWDARTVGEWAREIDGAFAVVNLTGRSVNCRYNSKNRRDILESRVLSTRAIGEAIGRCANPPAVWLNASTATIYKHSIDKPMDENAEMAATTDAKDEFSVEVAMAWEKALFEPHTPKTRRVALRISMVLVDEPGSVFPVLRRLVKRGLGGALAGGQQYVSWIHHADFCRAIEWALSHNDVNGGINIAAPNPITNREMMRTLRRVCGMPFGLPATGWMMEIGAFFMRTETELMLKSRRVVPGRLLREGFKFKFARFEEAAEELEMRMQVRK